MNNDESGIGLPPPTRPAPPMPECKLARNIAEFRELAAVATLERLGYTWGGGAEWKPPLGAVPKFILDTLEHANAAAGLKPWPGETACNFRNRILAQGDMAATSDSSLETSEDEARPYGPGAGLAPEKSNAAPEQADQPGAADEDAISKALVALDDIAQAYDRHDMGLPLWLPEQHEKLAEVLRKMLADHRAALAHGQGTEMSAAARDVLAERRRQQEVEGWKPEHDDRHIDCELAAAAAVYALCTRPDQLRICDLIAWPWKMQWWKPTTYRRNLEKAGALILAEIERLDRAAEKGGAE